MLAPEGDIYVYSLSKTPPSINNFAFYYVFAEGHLIVPFGCVEAYKMVEGWSHFGEYIEAGDVNGDGNINGEDITCLAHSLVGRTDE